MIGCHIEDISFNKTNLEDVEVGTEFYLVIKSEHSEGQTVDISLEDPTKDYEYKGIYMEDDLITDIIINGDITKVKIKAMKRPCPFIFSRYPSASSASSASSSTHRQDFPLIGAKKESLG